MLVPASGLLDVVVELTGIRLRTPAVFQEQQTFLTGRHGADEGFPTFQRGAQALRNRAIVNWLGECEIA